MKPKHRELESIFASRAQTRVVQYFLDHPKGVLLQGRIARETGLAHSTVARVMQLLVKIRIVTRTELSERVVVFNLNNEDRKTKTLVDFYTQIIPLLNEKLGLEYEDIRRTD